MKDSMIGKWIEYDHVISNGKSIRPYAKGCIRLLDMRKRRKWHVRLSIHFAYVPVGHTVLKPTSLNQFVVCNAQPAYLNSELSSFINGEFTKALKEITDLSDGFEVKIFSVIVRCTVKG